MRAFLVTCIFAISMSSFSAVYVGDSLIHSTQEIMYEAEEFASVPANFQPMSSLQLKNFLKLRQVGNVDSVTSKILDGNSVQIIE